MRIPKDAKVNGEVAQKANGIPVYRVKLVDGPAAGVEVLTLSNEITVNGKKYALDENGDFKFAGDL